MAKHRRIDFFVQHSTYLVSAQLLGNLNAWEMCLESGLPLDCVEMSRTFVTQTIAEFHSAALDESRHHSGLKVFLNSAQIELDWKDNAAKAFSDWYPTIMRACVQSQSGWSQEMIAENLGIDRSSPLFLICYDFMTMVAQFYLMRVQRSRNGSHFARRSRSNFAT